MSLEPPPREIPSHLKNEFTMNGKTRVVKCYRDDYTNKIDINKTQFTKAKFKEWLDRAKAKKPAYYGITDRWLFDCLDKYPISKKKVVVMGSESPWYESICLSYGCKDITVIEYNKITYQHPNIKYITPDEYDENPVEFDVAVSISSFEHDGLGRYGDPINPTGDLEIMKKMKKIVKPNGLMILAVPVGVDSLYWNVHRYYGRYRFPLLIQNWEKIDSFGFKPSLFSQTKHIQPVFVLKNTVIDEQV